MKLGSDLAELKRLAGWIESQQELSDETSFAIQLCLEEAVANIIMYAGAGQDDRLEITVHLERNDGIVVARIEDNGREFDPTRFPPLSVAKSLEEAKVGDLGIHLMRGFAWHALRAAGRLQSADAAVCGVALIAGQVWSWQRDRKSKVKYGST